MQRSPKSSIDKAVHQKIILIIIMTVVICSLLLCAVFNRTSVAVTLNGPDTVEVEYGNTYEEQGAASSTQNSLLSVLNKALDTVTTGTVDVGTLGTYEVTYTASYSDMIASAVRKVIVQDTTAPRISLYSDPASYTPYGHAYTEEGFSAYDLHDGDVTANVQSEEADGRVYYTVTDSCGNVRTAYRKIIYDDRKGPDITLEGGDTVTVYVGSGYTDSYSAVDDVDGDVTADVTVEGSVDSNTIGTYTLIYTVSDAHGNKSTAVRTVNVKAQPVNTVVNENSKTIYLTFDDGPGPYTDQLLDILDKYNVKATFFTTSAYPNYAYCIGEEAARGHTVAVHTYSHVYSSVYASTDAYWSDFNAQNAVIAQQTGQTSTMFRFPGGSSNTVSENYCTGIMSSLVNQANAMGYTYFDWNVSSGDAGGTTDTTTVYNNIVKYVTSNSNAGYPSVVLQHDVKQFSVNAVESIIQWGLENGYSFSALSPGSYHAHHHVAN